jgi:hypothetical protein
MAQEKTQEINMNAEQQIADLQAQIETAKAKIAQLKAGMQEAKAEEMKQRVDNEEGNLQERNTADAIAAYEADKKNERELKGTRNEQGDFVEADDSPLVVKIKGSPKSDIDEDMRTDEESAKRKFMGVEPVDYADDVKGLEDMELSGGRTFAEEDESVERTMGFKTDDGGNMSVDEKDDFWQTQEGYDKAMEMYGGKPAFVPAEPTMIWNPEEQKYEKIKEEDKEQFEDLSTPSMSADIKKLFG